MLVAGLIGWQLWPGDPASEPAAVAAVPPASLVAATSPAPAPVAVSATTPVESVTRTTTTTPQTASPQAAPALPVATTTRPKPAPTRPRQATATIAPAPAPVRSEPVVAAPVAEAPPAPVVAPKPRGVDETCADRGNFFSRDLCRIQACGNPALAGDPVCVRFRDMEAANRSRTSN